jgi:hypothetical protein
MYYQLMTEISTGLCHQPNDPYKPIIIIVSNDGGYGSEDDHLFSKRRLHAFSVISARYEHVQIWKTHGKYRKQMKRGCSKLLYNQRNKDETIISVIKRLFGEHITSRLVRTHNRELSFRYIAYNTFRLTNLTIIIDGFYKAKSSLFSKYEILIKYTDVLDFIGQICINRTCYCYFVLGLISLSLVIGNILAVCILIYPYYVWFFAFVFKVIY